MFLVQILTSVVMLTTISSKPTITGCGGRAADITFVVDTSSSIWPPDFEFRILPFIGDVVQMFDVGPGAAQARVAMVTFGTTYYHQFHLKDYQDKDSLARRINNTPYKGGNTKTDEALDYVTRDVFARENGARDGVAHVIIVLTDGKSDDEALTRATAELAKGKGVHIFAIGVGTRVDYRELAIVASDPDDEFMFHVGNFQALDRIKKQLATRTCSVASQNPSTTSSSTTITTTTRPTTEPTSTTTANSTTTTTNITTTPTTPDTTEPTSTTTAISPTTITTTTTTPATTEPTSTTTGISPTTTSITTNPTTPATTEPTSTTAISLTTTTTTTTTSPATTEPTSTITSNSATTHIITTTTAVAEGTTTSTTAATDATSTTTTPTPSATLKFSGTSHLVDKSLSSSSFLDRPLKDQPLPSTEQTGCKTKPTDIYFLLDVSASLYSQDFYNKVLPFVYSIVSYFHISPDHTRVGVVTFSTNVTSVFDLDSYTSRDDLQVAISNIKHVGGPRTNTADAIAYVRDIGFAPFIVRKGVAKIAIVITDGMSFDPLLTVREAKAAKEAGINMFAVGVGPSVDPVEMAAIGSEPEYKFVFHVKRIDALYSLKYVLEERTCNIKGSPRVYTPEDCVMEPTDLMFVFESASKSPVNRRITRMVITDFAEKLKQTAEQVDVGSLTDPCPDEDDLSLLSLDAFQQKVHTVVRNTEGKMHRLIKKLRTEMFASHTTSGRRQVAVLFLDERTRRPARVVKEARRMKQRGVEVYVVAVGDVAEHLIAGSASDSVGDHVMRLHSYRHLKSVKLDKLWNICSDSGSLPIVPLPVPK